MIDFLKLIKKVDPRGKGTWTIQRSSRYNDLGYSINVISDKGYRGGFYVSDSMLTNVDESIAKAALEDSMHKTAKVAKLPNLPDYDTN